MSNVVNKDQTQDLIKETAKQLFFVKGKFDATTQEIAEAAGVNRTLINYYFRSRDNLVDIIFNEAKATDGDKFELMTRTDISLKDKIEKFIVKSLKTSIQYPYLETYIVTRLNKGNCQMEMNKLDSVQRQLLYKSIEEEMDRGVIEKMEPVQFILNLVSLLVFPSAMRPLLSENLSLSSEEFDRIIADRKDIIMNMLYKK